MASIINASSTGSGGLISTGDASGVLQLQSNGSVALTVSGSAVTFNGNTSPLIISGNNNGTYPTVASGGALSWNYTAGSAEVDFWNTSSSPATSFLWLQQTGASSVTRLMNLSPAGSLTFNQSGQGIVFTNSSALTNSTLNDYEVGSYTPTITASVSNPTLGYSNQYGQYTKVGRLVQFVAWIQLNSISGGSGNIQISLPFATANASVYYQSTSVWFQNMTFSNAFAQGLVQPNLSTMWITTMVSSKTSGYGNVTVADLGSTTEIRISGSYQASF